MTLDKNYITKRLPLTIQAAISDAQKKAGRLTHRAPAAAHRNTTRASGILVKRVLQGTCPNCGVSIGFGFTTPLTMTACGDCGSEILVPGRVDDFVLLERIGVGEMGEIYRARDEVLNRNVAIKVVRASRSDVDSMRERLRQEAQAAARVSHSHVAQVYALGFSNGYPYLVMELVGGEDMNSNLRREGLIDERKALQVAKDVAEGLNALHREGLKHGDVKPANIVLDRDGGAKLVDFGLSGMARLDGAGAIVGTPHYIAPETLRGATDTFQTDIYSLGATLYHLLSGRTPFDGETPTELVRARLVAPADPIRVHAPHLAATTERIVMRMMDPDPACRHPDCGEVIDGIREALDSLNSAPPPPPEPVETKDDLKDESPSPKSVAKLRLKSQKELTEPDSETTYSHQTKIYLNNLSKATSRRRRKKSPYALILIIGLAVAALVVLYLNHAGLLEVPGRLRQSPAAVQQPRQASAVQQPGPGTAVPPQIPESSVRPEMPAFTYLLTPQWISGSIGDRVSGSTGWGGDGTLIVQVMGLNRRSSADAYRYVHSGTVGDFAFSMQFVSLQRLARTGLMVRESSDDHGSTIFFGVLEDGSLILEKREAGQFEEIVRIARNPLSLPYYLRIARHGDFFEAATSADGIVWQVFADCILTLSKQTRAGLAAAVHQPGALGTAELRNIEIRTTVRP